MVGAPEAAPGRRRALPVRPATIAGATVPVCNEV
jgi:hypothetical protein